MSNNKRDFSNILCLDIYLSSLDEKERSKVSRKLKPMDHKLSPLLCGDIHSSHLQQLASEEKRKNDLLVLLQFHKKHNWNVNLDEILKNDYFTLVLTDAKQIILWASKNFSAMTGYPINYAVGRSPRFLQGINTSEEVRKRIRQQLLLGNPFAETVTNYRKNSEAYQCKVNIYPIRNMQQQVTHFLALESETID